MRLKLDGRLENKLYKPPADQIDLLNNVERILFYANEVSQPGNYGGASTMVDAARTRALLRTKGPAFAGEAVVNFVLPYLIYSYAEPSLGDVQALLASSVPPIV